MRSKYGPAFQPRPSLYADDHLHPGEREHYGDEVARALAFERFLAAQRRYRPPAIDPATDLVDEQTDEAPSDEEVATEVMDWRAGLLAGHPLPYRNEGVA